MPDIKLKNQVGFVVLTCIAHHQQPFDLEFHPSENVVFTGLLTGEVKAFRYDENTGESSSSWTTRPTKRTMRSVDVSSSGGCVWTGGKSGSIL